MPDKPWRLAKSLEVLRVQINDRWPNRAKGFDGSIGDAAHQARASDHDPNSAGVVCAIDITNDPQHEVHCAIIAEAIRSAREPRLKYLIFNHFMLRSYAKPGIPAWTWAPYVGGNAHDHHLHISVLAEKVDDPTPWPIDRRE